MFDRNRYHGTVIWSWQQALFAAGLDRQLARNDLTSSARNALLRAHSRVHAAIAAADALRGSELWSWSQSTAAIGSNRSVSVKAMKRSPTLRNSGAQCSWRGRKSDAAVSALD